jgi:hypothetical protein
VCDPVEVDARLAAAIDDNVRWCDLVCRTHGIAGRFDEDAWVSTQRTPPMYPDAITLRTDVSADALLTRIDPTPGCSIKDSFASVDLSERGFRMLFDGAWISRPAGVMPAAGRTAGGRQWTQVTEPRDLVAWADDHGGGSTFSADLLDEPSVTILAARDPSGRMTDGAIATVGVNAVGISNVFAARGATSDDAEPARFEEAFAAATVAIAAQYPDRAIVGYLSASRLPAARRVEYDLIGPMRVWMLDEP